MEEKKTVYLILTTILVDILGPPNALLNILIAVIALDYFTGFLRAAYERRLSSKVGARGIIKKIGYLSAVALAHQIDLWLGTGDAIRSLSVSLFIANETWSNMENLAAIGIVFPEPVTNKIKAVMTRASQGGEAQDETDRTL